MERVDEGGEARVGQLCTQARVVLRRHPRQAIQGGEGPAAQLGGLRLTGGRLDDDGAQWRDESAANEERHRICSRGERAEHHRRLDRGRRVSEVLRQRTQRAQFGRHGIGGCVDASGEALEGEARLGGVFRCA